MPRMVIAIGGNSLIPDADHVTVQDQYAAAAETDRHIASLVEDGWDVAISHGNGPQVGRLLQAGTERVYDDFIARVAEHRGMSEEAVDAVARGRVWSGEQAQEFGLVDRLGGLEEAVDAAARKAGLAGDYSSGYFQPTLSPFESFMAELTGETVAKLYPAAAAAPLAPRGFVADLLDDLRRIAANDGQFSVAAHCLCEVR